MLVHHTALKRREIDMTRALNWNLGGTGRLNVSGGDALVLVVHRRRAGVEHASAFLGPLTPEEKREAS